MNDGQITALVDKVLGAYGSPAEATVHQAPVPAPAPAPQPAVDDAVARAIAKVLSDHGSHTQPKGEAKTEVPRWVPSSRRCCWKPAEAPERAADEVIDRIVAKVLGGTEPAATGGPADEVGDGIFDSMDEAVEAAAVAQQQYLLCSMADRKRFVDGIRAVILRPETLERLSRLSVEETGMGRYEHKLIKNRLAAEKTPGTEDLATDALSGDDGLTLVEHSPYGVIGAITPTTNPTETIICNSIGMLAAGNSVVFSPHPRATQVSLLTVRLINQKLAELGAPANLVVTVGKPSIENTNAMMAHPKVRMLMATGGPAIVKAVMSTGKKAIGAGAGNPPVVVDETADIEKAARDIVNGCSFDNNLPCIAEKEIIAVDEIADFLVFAMKKNGAFHLTDPEQLRRLEALVLTEKGGPKTSCVGKDAAWLLGQIGVAADDGVRVILIEVPKAHPFVQEELMMPVLPLVRVRDVDEAIAVAIEVEHGNRHTAIMHSTNVRKLTQMAKLIQTTIFVKNGPSYAGIGAGGEGHATFTIAGPTGEGLTSARSFARRRRCVMVEALNIR
ncbi:aldehyde dehydrogenase family protein [Azospirillum sp. TSO35-2]|uniref:aldehyde dehydrogenase family protein n=1 Tax=Azospirillum sp. TSO35-2 TaxID=716796 RepID=UPI000D61A71B|nr:aldehyde dehydrogenase family protein [Azospirillum sp. TSO35-2]PWC32868.1 aldehyde dehydrogenase [Azospirillum sp. TSO35-2]